MKVPEFLVSILFFVVAFTVFFFYMDKNFYFSFFIGIVGYCLGCFIDRACRGNA